jgi:hypothetical protein
LGGGLHELRISLGDVDARVTHVFEDGTAWLLTAFPKRRDNEAREVARARRAQADRIRDRETGR